STGPTTESFVAACATVRFNSLHRNSRWLKGRRLRSLSIARTSAVELRRKLLFSSSVRVPLVRLVWLWGSWDACIGDFLGPFGLRAGKMSHRLKDSSHFLPKGPEGQCTQGEPKVDFI